MRLVLERRYTLSDRESADLDDLVTRALYEDLNGQSDLTTTSLVPQSASGTIKIVAREPGILSGGCVAERVFESQSTGVTYRASIGDGEALSPGTVIAEVDGAFDQILTLERTALNFLTLLSGVATLTSQFVTAVQTTHAKILDTRKTIPGLRSLQKYAVRCGGGTNHRFGLYDAVLIKDNHLAWWKKQAGGSLLADAVSQSRDRVPPGTIIEIEVDSIKQLQEVLPGSPDIVLLDNMSLSDLQKAVAIRDQIHNKVLLEASGGVNLQTVKAIAETGVDRISVGALTHSAPSLDIGFDWSGAIS